MADLSTLWPDLVDRTRDLAITPLLSLAHRSGDLAAAHEIAASRGWTGNTRCWWSSVRRHWRSFLH